MFLKISMVREYTAIICRSFIEIGSAKLARIEARRRYAAARQETRGFGWNEKDQEAVQVGEKDGFLRHFLCCPARQTE